MAEPHKRFTAFGVEPEQRAPFELRQARYRELGEDVAAYAARLHARRGDRVDLLDVGVYNGCSRRYIEVHPGAEHIAYHAVDLFPHGRQLVYKGSDWTLHQIDLETGMPPLADDRYDVILCEQVLEHLRNFRPALGDLVRVLRPEGLLIVGVPIFLHGIHLIRKHLVPRLDRWLHKHQVRGHVQAWSKGSFLRELANLPDLEVTAVRGFRTVSGGILRPLEFHAWWWRVNRWLGARFPGLCTEIQVVGRKRPRAREENQPPSVCRSTSRAAA